LKDRLLTKKKKIHVSETKHQSKTVLKVDGQLKVGDVDELTKAFRSANHLDLLDLFLRELVSSNQ
jgi:hypothetical protein